ncbi:hypothetical protein [Paenibacillus sp. Y412MC10]|uniref:hypothetical protein n=1 Tax=Geobacillus sp. (strain Y412MC10) TaxID=481743 RepID=UPI0011AB6B6D|nr:hypothetical protein [Paenibacillus sp. Y412MC10]
MDKIKMVPITITPGEGPIWWERTPKTIGSWEEADKHLEMLARDLPINRGTYKQDFQIRFADETIYNGTYGLSNSCIVPSLANHMSEYLLFHSGKKRPVHLSENVYLNLIDEHSPPGAKENWLTFIHSYEIPNLVVT